MTTKEWGAIDELENPAHLDMVTDEEWAINEAFIAQAIMINGWSEGSNSLEVSISQH